MERSTLLESARVLANLNPNIAIRKANDKPSKSTRGTRCGPPLERNSKLVESAKENGSSSALAKSLPPGTGVFFCETHSGNSGNSEEFCSELQDLVTLTLVACELDASSRRQQFLKKRRTPRNLASLKRSISKNPEGKLPEEFGGCSPTMTQRDELRNLKHDSEHILRAARVVSTFVESNDAREIGNNFTGRDSPNVKPCLTKTFFKALAPPPADLVVKAYNRPVDASRPPQTNGASFSKRFPSQSHVHTHETRVQRFSKRILQFVGERTIAEKFIRKSLGNNPDTSKALRLLLKQQKIHRLGEGGRGKAFEYVVTNTGLAELAGLKTEGEREQPNAIPLVSIPQTIRVM